MATGLITHPFIVCFLSLSHFPTTLLVFPGITSQINDLCLNPVSEPASGRTHFHVYMEMSAMQLDMNLEFGGEVQTIDESLAKVVFVLDIYFSKKLYLKI